MDNPFDDADLVFTYGEEQAVEDGILKRFLTPQGRDTRITGYTNVDTTLNVYTQVLDGSVRAAVETVGDELFTIVHKTEAGSSRSGR